MAESEKPAEEKLGEDLEKIVLPRNPQTVFLGGLFVFALLACFYIAADIILPFVLAFVMSMLLQPAMRRLQKWRIPKMLAAAVMILAVFGTIVIIGAGISGPAATWAAKLPEGIPRVQEKLSFLRAPIAAVQRLLQRVENAAPVAGGTTAPAAITVKTTDGQNSFLNAVVTGTRNFASGLLTTILFLFFLLVSGDIFLRRLVEILPSFAEKRLTMEISNQIEQDISMYLTTVTIMNAIVGILTGLVMWATGVGDPFLWGAVAFLLNYVPIIGWLTGIVTFILAGMLTFETLGEALLPAGLYLLIHIAEGETVTPMLLARRFTLNPVIVVMSLVFWFWMWGVPGAIIAVPMLVMVKIVCDRIRPLQAFGHFLSGARDPEVAAKAVESAEPT
ncbi:MAG TPA: AI-2E family transporter [Bauldia sp.]|nr:AI-2E family transporter [Bauldia sp.]